VDTVGKQACSKGGGTGQTCRRTAGWTPVSSRRPSSPAGHHHPSHDQNDDEQQQIATVMVATARIVALAVCYWFRWAGARKLVVFTAQGVPGAYLL